MKCPKCGYKRQLRDNAYVPSTECPSCGIVYSKTLATEMFGWSGTSPSTVAGVKSPVDETTLRQARERVESRLRKRLETKLRDERHQQTLARAKEITAARLRKQTAEKAPLPEEQTHPETPNGGKLARAVESAIGAAQTLPKRDTPVLEDEDTALLEAAANDTLSEPLEDDILMEALLDQDAADDTLVEELAVNDTWPTFGGAEAARIPPRGQETEHQPAPPEDSSSGIEPEKALVDPNDVQIEPTPATSIAAFAPLDDHERHADMADDNSVNDHDPVHPGVPEPAVAAAMGRSAQTVLGSGLMRLFNVVAWLILTAGVSGAVLSWTTLSNVEAGVRLSVPTIQGGLPLGLLLGFAYLATGVLGFAFFWVSSQISHQLKDIRRLLLVSPHTPFPGAHH